MQIGEIAQLTGFSKDTIRWYEKIGLIQLDKKNRTENNYRNYSNENLKRLLDIKQMKAIGFTLKDIEHIFLLDKHEEVNCGNVGKVVENRLEKIAQKIAELQDLQMKLIRVKSSCRGNCKTNFESI